MELRVLFILMFWHPLQINSDGGEKIVIDTDAGSDDGAAILMLLRYEASEPKLRPIEIIGITCTYGNVNEEQVQTNVLRTLSVADRTDIPVYSGSTHGYIKPFQTDAWWGTDGFGDVDWDHNVTDAQVDRSKHAAVALIDMAQENTGNISIISLAPLTNIALAISLDQNFIKNIKTIYEMGAVVNNSRTLEFNFAADPESNFVLYNATSSSQIVLFPQDTFLKTFISKEWRMKYLGKFPSPYMEFMNKIESKVLSRNSTRWNLPDLMTVACFIEPSLVTSHSKANIVAVTEGLRRGSVDVDYDLETNKTKNTIVIQSIDVALFKTLVVRYLTCIEIPC